MRKIDSRKPDFCPGSKLVPKNIKSGLEQQFEQSFYGVYLD